jgi:hypothetical protein
MQLPKYTNGAYKSQIHLKASILGVLENKNALSKASVVSVFVVQS